MRIFLRFLQRTYTLSCSYSASNYPNTKKEGKPLACFHFDVSVISRGHGRSVTAASAYISGGKFRDAYDGRIHDRSYRRDVVYKEILLPPEAPTELSDRQLLLDALNRVEKRNDAQMARSIHLALPNELSLSEQVALVREFVEVNFTRYGLCADIAIHQGELDEDRKPASIEPVGERKDNRHAHIIIPFRGLDEHGFCRTKQQTRFMNNPAYLIAWRKSWADLQNREFEKRGLPVRVSHETLAAQGIDREPTKHLGPGTMALELRGVQTDRGNIYREIMRRNREREERRQKRRNRNGDRQRSR